MALNEGFNLHELIKSEIEFLNGTVRLVVLNNEFHEFVFGL